MGNGKFMSKFLEVPVRDLFKVVKEPVSSTTQNVPQDGNYDNDDSSEDDMPSFTGVGSYNTPSSTLAPGSDNLSTEHSEDGMNGGGVNSGNVSGNVQNSDSDDDERNIATGKPTRIRRQPQRLLDEIHLI